MTHRQAMQFMADCLERMARDPNGGPHSFAEAALYEMAASFVVLMHKHDLRGVGNLKDQGLYGIISRLVNDKGARLTREAKVMTMLGWCQELGLEAPAGWSQTGDVGDSFTDDLVDVENYSVLARLYMAGRLDLPD